MNVSNYVIDCKRNWIIDYTYMEQIIMQTHSLLELKLPAQYIIICVRKSVYNINWWSNKASLASRQECNLDFFIVSWNF